MKKIIGGRRYDTDTATFLASDGNGRSDFSWRCEELYLKKTGEYFLYGQGGPMSKYSACIDQNTWSGGEEIIPLTEEKARKWAEDHCTADVYEKIFGEAEE